MSDLGFAHGGNIYEVKRKFRKEVVDFSANINPLGLTRHIKEAIHNNIESILHYPDPEAKDATKSIAAYWRIKEENVLISNGSIELIYLILSTFRPKTVLITIPTFSEYERAARISGSQVLFIHMLEGEGFCLNFDHINNCDMLFMCNPNNPTGNLIVSNRADIKNIPVKRIVIDEAFMDFVPNEKIYTLIPQAVRSKKIMVLRTLTKFFALPGLRVGYLIAHRDIIRILKEYQMPWSVNVLAQVAAGQCLSEDGFIQRSKQLIAKERAFLYERFDRIRELKPYLSVANFLLVKIKDNRHTSSCLKERLLKKRILIRDCANFRGLDNRFIRVAVRTHKENMQLVQALKECI